MNTTVYMTLSQQVLRQQAELTALQAEIDSAQPDVDTLQAAYDSALVAYTNAAEADREARAADLEAARIALNVELGPQTERISHAESLTAAIARCQQAMTDSGLTPSPEDIEAARLAEVKRVSIARIDAEVDAIVGDVVGNRVSEYARAEREANAFKDANYPAEAVPGSVQSWATAKGWTAQQAADNILATAATWRSAQEALRDNRLLRKEQVRVAVNDAAINTAMGNWATFRSFIRSSLGV